MDTEITLTSIVVGSLLPNLIAIIVQPAWRKETRGLVAFGLCVVAGLLVAMLQGEIGRGQDIAASVVAVLVTSQVLYQALWRPSGIVPAIEQASSLTLERGAEGLTASGKLDRCLPRTPAISVNGCSRPPTPAT